MERHPYFDLWLHETDELSALLSKRIVTRKTLHEWPLSCVQLLEFDDGSRLIYKTQNPESIEAVFYANAQSSLLPNHIFLGNLRGSITLVFEYIETPELGNMELKKDEILRLGREIIEVIHKMNPNLPVYYDISSTTLWLRKVDDTLSKLTALIDQGKFIIIRRETVQKLREWANEEEIRRTIIHRPSIAHTDLSPDNIFLTPKGIKVIDWQYPKKVSSLIDWVSYLDGAGIEPLEYAPLSAVDIFWFIRLSWFVECKYRLFPEGESYDQQVADLAEKILDKLI